MWYIISALVVILIIIIISYYTMSDTDQGNQDAQPAVAGNASMGPGSNMTRYRRPASSPNQPQSRRDMRRERRQNRRNR